MASSRQIEHLERKHKENPEGLTFAPLANAYRNTGQPERAIEILMQGLAYHADHAPARIVLGRCHLDLGDDAAAETAFGEVLDLDNENVVALKALADITERNGRFTDAERWLSYLLEVDRNNDEAREQLERVRAAKEEAGGDLVAAPEPVAQDDLVASEAPVAEEAPVVEEAPEAAPEPTPWAEPSTADTTPEAVVDEPAPEPSPWQPPAVEPDAVAHAASEDLEGPGGPAEAEGQHWFDREHTESVPPASESEGSDLGLSYETEDEIELRPSERNIYQQPDAAEGLGINAHGDSEYQVADDTQDLELHGSEENEFQRPPDADALAARDDSVEEPAVDAGLDLEQPHEFSSAQAEDVPSIVDPVSEWLAPSEAPAPAEPAEPETPAEAAAGESPGTVEEEQPEIEAAVPFEEAEPLPSSWESGQGDEASEEAPPADGGEPTPAPAEATSLEPLPAEPLPPTPWEPEAPPPPPSAEAVATEAELAELPSDEDVVAPVDEPEVVATETMAEVYLSQGHRAEALRVYRLLSDAAPDDARLKEKVAVLAAELGDAPAPDTDEVETEAPPAPLAGAETTSPGGTVRAMFQGLLTAQPTIPEVQPDPEAPAPRMGASQEPVGEPTRPAKDPLSLSAVFGEDTSPVPPAVGGESSGKSEGFSFDSFFGQERGGTGRHRRVATRRAGEEEEDLDQFHAWLQGLKG